MRVVPAMLARSPGGGGPRSEDRRARRSGAERGVNADRPAVGACAVWATIATEPATVDYGKEAWFDRGYEAVDLEGHHWYFAHRVR